MDDRLCIKWDGPLGWHIGSPDGSRLKQEAKGKCSFMGHLILSYWAEMMRVLASDLK